MSSHEPDFEMPKNLERYISIVSKIFATDGEKSLQQILVNSRCKIVAAWSSDNWSDNWNGPKYGHALYLTLPEALYLDAIKHKDPWQNRIKDAINKIHNVPDEFIEEVFFEPEPLGKQDWRKDSGALLKVKEVVLPETLERIWSKQGFRIFISHKAEFKKEASELKAKLAVYGISSFVAHEDVLPTKEWQDEIENALSSMDGLVALLTEDFHDSNWTDQEIGFAFGVGVPIIPVRLGKDPYGLIGKFQALCCPWDSTSSQIVTLLTKYEKMINAYINVIKECNTYENANTLSKMLPNLDSISPDQTREIISAFNNNDQIHNSFGFNGRKKSFGEGLAFHLNRLTGKNFFYTSTGEIIDDIREII